MRLLGLDRSIFRAGSVCFGSDLGDPSCFAKDKSVVLGKLLAPKERILLSAANGCSNFPSIILSSKLESEDSWMMGILKSPLYSISLVIPVKLRERPLGNVFGVIVILLRLPII